MDKHTPTPWNHRPKDLQNPVRYLTIDDNGFDRIFAHVLPTDKDDALANAAYIVRAVNAHDELLEASRMALVELEREANCSGAEMMKAAVMNLRYAIAKAEAK